MRDLSGSYSKLPGQDLYLVRESLLKQKTAQAKSLNGQGGTLAKLKA